MYLKKQVEDLTTNNQELEKGIAPLREQMKSLDDKHALEIKQIKESNESIMNLIKDQFREKNKISNYLIIGLGVGFLLMVIYALIR
jgi:flagellar motility protein MotE (MotC chaperone)